MSLKALVFTAQILAVRQQIHHTEPNSIPWAILIVNVLGAFVIGLVASIPNIMNNEARRYFIVTGLLGGFTTYSAFAVDLVNMNVGNAVIYLVATFAAGILATHFGSALVKA